MIVCIHEENNFILLITYHHSVVVWDRHHPHNGLVGGWGLFGLSMSDLTHAFPSI
jgi:hypothetical protein